MAARYLIRFDDLCPTMNWGVWEEIEVALVRLGIRPILAVVPDNRDEFLVVDSPREDFWDRVRSWHARGWTIGMHGYQHRSVTDDSGLIGINDRSEFAGLPTEEQARRLREGLLVFEREGVRPEVFLAPNSSLDRTTVRLLASSGIQVISDGLWILPFREPAGTVWVPHQIWRFHSMPFGVWTVGCHHNRWRPAQTSAFLSDLERFRDRITDLPTVLERYGWRRRAWIDRLASVVFLRLIRLKRRARDSGLLKVPTDAY